MRGDGKTVIRGGGSIMYEQIPLITFTAVGNQLGLNQSPLARRRSSVLRTPPERLREWQHSDQQAGPWQYGGVSSRRGRRLTHIGLAGPNGRLCERGNYCVWQHLPRSILQLQCGDGRLLRTRAGLVTDPAPCNIEAVDPNLRTPYISTWTLTIQRAITNDLSLEVAYVGNHGTKLLGFRNINQPPLGSSYPGFGSADPMVNEVLSCNTARQSRRLRLRPRRCKRESDGPAVLQ